MAVTAGTGPDQLNAANWNYQVAPPGVTVTPDEAALRAKYPGLFLQAKGKGQSLNLQQIANYDAWENWFTQQGAPPGTDRSALARKAWQDMTNGNPKDPLVAAMPESMAYDTNGNVVDAGKGLHRDKETGLVAQDNWLKRTVDEHPVALALGIGGALIGGAYLIPALAGGAPAAAAPGAATGTGTAGAGGSLSLGAIEGGAYGLPASTVAALPGAAAIPTAAGATAATLGPSTAANVAGTNAVVEGATVPTSLGGPLTSTATTSTVGSTVPGLASGSSYGAVPSAVANTTNALSTADKIRKYAGWGAKGASVLGALFAPKGMDIEGPIKEAQQSARELGTQSATISGMGAQALYPTLHYLSALQSGDPTSILQATMPERRRIIDQYDTAKQTTQFMPRGGGTAASLIGLETSKAKDLAEVGSKARQDAFKEGGDLGKTLTATGLQGKASSTNALVDVLHPIGQERGRDQKSVWDTFSGIGSLIANW